MKQRVIEANACNRDAQLITDGEVTGSQRTWIMILREYDRFIGSEKRSPSRDSSLESPPRRIGELPGVSLLEVVEECLRFEPWFGLEFPLNIDPNALEGIDSGAILSAGFPLRGKPLVVAVGACRFLVHGSHPSRVFE